MRTLKRLYHSSITRFEPFRKVGLLKELTRCFIAVSIIEEPNFASSKLTYLGRELQSQKRC